MNIVKAGYEILLETNSKDPLRLTKKIESVARICYKSEDLITEDSCVRMVGNLIKRQHYAMLEHASIVLEVDETSFYDTLELKDTLEKGLVDGHEYETFKSYLRFTDDNARYIISGNIRAWVEFLQICVKFFNKIPFFFGMYLACNRLNVTTDIDVTVLFKEFLTVPHDTFTYPMETGMFVKQIEDLSELSIRERLVHEDLSVKLTVDRGVTHELCRHRDCSFAQESTRYVSYSKDKFGNEITVIEPCFWVKDRSEEDNNKHDYWVDSCEMAEAMYFQLLKYGATPQEARDVLPTSTKADIVVTTNIREWIHILELRALGTTGKPHPQMEEVMIPLAKELVSGLLSDFTCIDSVNKMLTTL